MRPSLTQKQQKETHKGTDTELCTVLAKMALQLSKHIHQYHVTLNITFILYNKTIF